VQAQIINLLLDLQDRLKLSILFVAHDLGVVRHMSDRIAVMYIGRIVETGPTDNVYRKPLHPYTEALLASVPKPNPRLKAAKLQIKGDVADPSKPPSGCHFHPRCTYATDCCRTEVPALRAISTTQQVACHYAEELQLKGVA
jgi:oligopeptide/dipeptide ABC transporter ATP-binding protein